MKKIKKSKKFVVILLILSIFAISCAAATAAEVDDGATDLESDYINTDDLATVDGIEVAQAETSPSSAVSDDSASEAILGAAYDEEQLGTTYENAYGNQLGPMYESDKNYTENHVFELKDSQGRVYQPTADALEFLSHFREISGGYAYRDNQNHPLDLYWTANENGTIYLILNDWDNQFKDLHGELKINGHKYEATDDFVTMLRDDGTPYQYICVCKFTNVHDTSSSGSFTINRNHGPKIKLPGGVSVLNSTNISLWVNDKFEDTIYLGQDAILHNVVLYIPSKVEITNGIVYYNVTAPDGSEIIIPVGTSAPGGTITFHPEQTGTYMFKAWYPEYINESTQEHNFESHSNVVVLHVVKPPENMNVTVYKIWEDGNDADGLRPGMISINLTGSDGQTYTATIPEVDGSRWSYVFENLPAFKDGERITYTVKEDSVPDGYNVRYDGLTIYNTHVLQTRNITVYKIWDDGSDRDGLRPESVTFNLTADGETVGTATFSGEGNRWSYTFTNLRVHNEDGSEIIYAIVEDSVPDGYVNTTNGFTITNDHSSERTNIIVTKIWDDDSNRDLKRPDEITLVLTGTDGFVYSSLADATVVKNGDTWTYNFTVRKYYNHGQEVVFTVSESVVPENYTVSYDQNALTVTNTHEIEKTEITVTKIWDDDSNRDGIRPSEVTITITGGDQTYSKTFSGEGDTWTWTFTDVIKNQNGNEIKYTISEDEVADYTATYDQEAMKVTNTHKIKTADVTVTKKWEDDDNRDGIRPDSVSITLTGGDITKTGTITEAEDGTWTITFKDLPVNYQGQAITYEAQETTVPTGYSANVNGLTITNTHEIEKTEITVTKIWEDNDNQDKIRPESIEITLTGSDGSERTAVIVENADGWIYVFSDLPVNDKGKAIEYSVKENEVPEGYAVSYDGLTITNTHNHECDVGVTVTASKAEVLIGEVVEYIITVVNNGPYDATGVYVNSTILPEGLTYITDNLTDNQYGEQRANLLKSALRGDTPGYDQSTGIWTIGDLAVGEEVKIAILARADVLGEHVISEVVTADSDVNPDNNKDSTTVNVIAISDLSIEKTVDKTKINVGDTVTYTFTVSNNGPSNATGVKMTDKDIITHEFVSASSEDYDPSTGVWTIGDLANGESVTLTVTVRINEAGTFSNTATVSGDQDDNNTSNNNASSDDVDVSEVPDEQPDEEPDEEPEEPTMTPKEAGELPKTGNPLFVLIISLMVLTGAMIVRRE